LRLLADENFPKVAVEALRRDGHDVVWVRAEFPGVSDREVLARSMAESRIVITFDKDFGELALRSGLFQTGGIILFRLPLQSPTFVADLAVKVLRGRTDWAGHFSVVEVDRIRMVPLPRKPQ
jgi:predicted nuclease of predicted toxin-antitoxin system